MRLFYVYEHWRPDRDECFYVGKGQGRRANVMYGRNRRHTNIQAKLERLGMCVEVRMVAEGLSEAEAHTLEVERIAFWRGWGVSLANLTAGGEGASDPSPETRELMRAAKLGRTLTEEHKAKIGTASKAALASPELRERLSVAIRKGKATPEARAKASASQKARVRTKEHYEKVSKALTGRKLSPEHAEKSRRASLGRKQPREEVERRTAAIWTPERRASHSALVKEWHIARRAQVKTTGE